MIFISAGSFLQYYFRFNPFNAPLPYATFGNPMYLGAWLAVTAPVCIYGWLNSRKEKTRLFAVSSVMAVIAVLLTRSQAAYLGMAAGVSFILFRKFGERRGLLYSLLTVVLIIVIYAGFFKKGDSGFEDSVIRRIRYYETTFEMIKKNPVKGIGFGNYRGRYAFYRVSSGVPAHTSVRWAHCDALHFAAELGIVRALIFIVLFFAVLLKKTAKEKDGYKAALISMGAVSLLAFPFQRISTLIIFSLLAGVLMREDRQRRTGKNFKAGVLANSALASAMFVFSILYAFAQIQWKKGLVNFENGYYEASAPMLKNASVIIRNDYRLPMLLGRTYYRAGDFTSALKNYRDAMKFYFDWDICYDYALALKAAGNNISAAQYFETAKMLRPGLNFRPASPFEKGGGAPIRRMGRGD